MISLHMLLLIPPPIPVLVVETKLNNNNHLLTESTASSTLESTWRIWRNIYEFMSDEGLKEVLGHGVGYYNETLSEQDTIVQRLFESGAVQVLVYLRVYCYR